MLDALTRDIRLAVRSLRRSPLFAVTAAVTIGLGIGATSTVLSVANRLLVRAPDGVRDAGELATVHAVARDGSGFHSLSYLDYVDLRSGQSALAPMAAFSPIGIALGQEGDPLLVIGLSVSSNYFTTLGTRPALGRFFLGVDERAGGEPVVVLSDGLWRSRFGADSTVVGTRVLLNGRPVTVVGVAEAGFKGHVAAVEVALWVPFGTDPVLRGESRFEDRRLAWLGSVGRLASGSTRAVAQSALDAVGTRLRQLQGQDGWFATEVRRYVPVVAAAAAPIGGFVALLLVLAGLILLIASVNVGGILLTRAASRRKEVALRFALGSGRGPLVRQLLVESVLLFSLGAALGLVIASAATQVLRQITPPVGVPLSFEFGIEGSVLAATVLVALVAGLGFGLAPAWQGTAVAPGDALRAGADGTIGRSRLRGLFVVAQVAGSVLLLVTAGLFVRGLSRAGDVDLGMDPNGLHSIEVDFGMRGRDATASERMAREAERRIADLPGVEAVGRVEPVPLSLSNEVTRFLVPGQGTVEGAGAYRTDFARVSPTYHQSVGIDLVAGRQFGDGDVDGAPQVAIVNETVARAVWPTEAAVGQTILFGSFDPARATPIEIVGVVRDSKYRSISESSQFMVFLPFAQMPAAGAGFLIRVAPGSQAVAAARQAIRELDPALPFTADWPYTSVLGLSLLPTRIAASLASGFGVVGLVLAMVGLYGVVAFAVSRRLKEYGIRMALGASHADVRRTVLRDGIRPTLVGLAVGGLAAIGAGQLIRGFLFGLSPIDPVTLGGITIILLAAALLACAVPSWRASKTDPMEVLRYE